MKYACSTSGMLTLVAYSVANLSVARQSLVVTGKCAGVTSSFRPSSRAIWISVAATRLSSTPAA